jgi:dATP pyrophosphohydrolase
MARLPIQVLVIPARHVGGGEVEYAALHRRDGSMWQFVAGGVEEGETLMDAAVRQAAEEASVPPDVRWMKLDSFASVPRAAFPGGAHWPADVYVVPEHCFAVDVTGHDLRLSAEHATFDWLTHEHANRRLTWQSNQHALWELNQRLRQSDMAK